MQKIISHGNIMERNLRTNCTNCGCDFTYEANDVHMGRYKTGDYIKYVFCPECLNDIIVDMNVSFPPR